MNRAALVILITAAAFSLCNCGKSETGAAPVKTSKSATLTAATLGEQSILAAGEYLTRSPYAAADTGRGAALSMQCRACHTLEKGGPSVVGPNLYGIFGRKAGGDAEYAYSDALADTGFVWTPRALDAWLAEPYSFLPGNRMTFPGLTEESDRNAVIAYLLKLTSSDGS